MRRPPGTKRLIVALSVVAYVLLMGIPVWWRTTSLHRPPLPHHDISAAARAAQAQSVLLPISLRVVLAVPAGAGWADKVSADGLLASIKAAAPNTAHSKAPLHLSATLSTAGQCVTADTHGSSARYEQQAACLDLSAAPLVSSSTDGLQGQRQLDDWLAEQQLQAAPRDMIAASRSTAQTPGHYTIYLLPAAAGHSEADSSSNSNVQVSTQLVVGRYRHAWVTYNPTQTRYPQQLLDLASAAAGQALGCCFGLHSTKAAISAAESLPVSAAGHTQLSFSLLNADPSAGTSYSWDFEQFERRYLSKVAASLAPVCQVSMTSQVLQYTPARTEGKWSRKHDAYVVKHSQLPFFIDSEWAVESGGGVLQQPNSTAAAHEPKQYSNLATPAGQQYSQVAGISDQATSLDSHVLHFLVYVPAPSHRPLLLLGPKGRVQDSNSFWIPSYGGLVVLNPNDTVSVAGTTQQSQQDKQHDGEDNSQKGIVDSNGRGRAQHSCDESSSYESAVELDGEQYQYVASVVIAQLQALFGVVAGSNTTVPPLAGGNNVDITAQQLAAGAAGFTSWQVDALIRQRAGFDVLEASRVLAGLSKLVQELPNLEMPDLIGQQVQTALQDIKLAWQHIAAGDYHRAGAAAAAARAAAEAAFLHPAVLAQLNFPESHKLGVYMPLFLPVSVPLMQGLVGQLAHYITKRRSYTAATARQ